jgi:hypothetical protein
LKIYLSAIAGYLPPDMVECISTFIDACYIARRNTITAPMLQRFNECVLRFHELRSIFTKVGVRTSISLPRQHALSHYYKLIQLFGSPNGLCSSITESKHIKAVKEPWRRSSRFKALAQMLCSIVRMEKMAAISRVFSFQGMLQGTVSKYIARQIKCKENSSDEGFCDSGNSEFDTYDDEATDAELEAEITNGSNDVQPVSGDPSRKLVDGTTDILLSKRARAYSHICLPPLYTESQVQNHTTLDLWTHLLPTSISLISQQHSSNSSTNMITQMQKSFQLYYLHMRGISTFITPQRQPTTHQAIFVVRAVLFGSTFVHVPPIEVGYVETLSSSPPTQRRKVWMV